MIAIKNVRKTFGREVIFDGLNLDIETCGIHVIEGPSGSGKSTLLHLIMGFEQPDQGEIRVDSQPVMIFQNYELLTELSVKDNLLLGRDESRLDMDLVRYFEMEDLLSRRIDELSGGQRQRVGIIRALSFHPTIILCDEPTESLDVHNKHLVMSLLKKYAQKATVLLVSHDHEMVRAYGDVFYVLTDHRIHLKEHPKQNLPPMTEQTHLIFEKTEMKNILTSLTQRKERITTFFRAVLFLLLGGMLIGVNQWLYVPETTRTANANYMYVELKENNEMITTAYFDTPMRRACMKFQSAYYQDSYYDIDIYPSIDANEGVYVNQNVLKLMEGVGIGDWLILYYIVDGIEYPYEVVIHGVIEDPDLNEPLIYYDATCFEDYLKTIPYTSPTDESLTNQYEYMQKEKPWIEFEVPYADQKAIKEAAMDDIRLVIHAPLLEQRQAFIEETAIYHVLYLVLEIFLFSVLVILDWIVFWRDLKKVKDNLAVLISQGMSLACLKRCYFIKQCQMMSISWFVVTIGLLIMAALSHALDLIMLPLALWTGYTLLYIVFAGWRIHQISTKEMSWILKDRWD